MVEDNYRGAMAERWLIDQLLATRGSIPEMVLQAEIRTLVLSCRRKFSLRSYILVVNEIDECVMYLHHRVEVRLAPKPMVEGGLGDGSYRDRGAHITNGAGGSATTRCLLEDVEELAGRRADIHDFMRRLFVDVVCGDIVARAAAERAEREPERAGRQFAFAGVDLMVDEAGKIQCLEVNVNPAAPPKGVSDERFEAHLVQLAKELFWVVSDRGESTCINSSVSSASRDHCSSPPSSHTSGGFSCIFRSSKDATQTSA